MTHPEQWVDEHGDYLFRFALARIRDRAKAEDLVQETFLAALMSRTFAGRSSERTWLAGILKNKILEHFRKTLREVTFTEAEVLDQIETEAFTAEGWSRGKWRTAWTPGAWSPDPGESLDREAFWAVFWECVEGLPPRVAGVFLQRELDDLESEDICAASNITPNNLWVMLHRARLALRRCLEANWFRGQGGKDPE